MRNNEFIICNTQLHNAIYTLLYLTQINNSSLFMLLFMSKNISSFNIIDIHIL